MRCVNMIHSMYYVCSSVTMCQNKMQVDQEDQKHQSGDNGDKKSEAEEMEVTLCWAIRSNKLQCKHIHTTKCMRVKMVEKTAPVCSSAVSSKTYFTKKTKTHSYIASVCENHRVKYC